MQVAPLITASNITANKPSQAEARKPLEKVGKLRFILWGETLLREQLSKAFAEMALIQMSM